MGGTDGFLARKAGDSGVGILCGVGLSEGCCGLGAVLCSLMSVRGTSLMVSRAEMIGLASFIYIAC